ncbi:MAG: class I tRNA ligase family protein [Anaerolineae bacterium]|nr:class I tRNA ligase family protein [Anaerolineae bacterium]MDW8098365.1 class I tRNA ligase family protein [Anaerolineae bacterium]
MRERFKSVVTQPDFPALEREILRFWDESKAFKLLQQKNAGRPRWSFIDGPITANNPMGVHHAWGRTYKDLFQRFKAMQGFDQRWQNGFDCQGLWVEVNVERDLGFRSKRDIEAFGIDRFVRLCKARVLTYAAVQTQQSIRLGYWMDWNDPEQLLWLRDKLEEDPSQIITVEGPNGPVTDTVEQIVGRLGLPELGGSYFTFSNENNYQIWGFLKRCWENRWLYKGTDVMPWCPRCGTGISQHEIVTEGYVERTDPGLTVRFPLRDRPGEALLVWTTTPWTLTSNVAAAVGPDLTYLRVRQADENGRMWIYYVAEGAAKQALRGHYEVLGSLKGAEMVGWRYEGPFDELPAIQTANVPTHHCVIPWDEVGEQEGTGIVHIAPGCGAEDFQLGKQFGLPTIAPLDESGIYLDGFDWLTGRDVATVTEPIIENLKSKGLFYRLEPYTHRYPECWRCHTPLVFRLVDEWFISMDELRYQMMDITRQIRWIPEFGLERELDWLRNMHDWMISKKRYWGLALPIWECHQCGHFEVIGDEYELKERAAEGWEVFDGHTPHRPWIDAIKIRCSRCGELINRIPDVGNPWLDAGIVPFSTLRYRTDRAYWEKWFPADFITESFPGQFRNWFYSLLAMSTVLERKPPFRTVLGYATLLGEDGREMHKSWGNMIEFNEAAEAIGVDTMRWMYCAHRPEVNLLFGYRLADEVRRRFILPLWNVYAFFVTYANLAPGWHPKDWRSVPDLRSPQLQILDRWIISRLHEVVRIVTDRLEDFDAFGATQALETFVDDLSDWYVRRSRRRFWDGEPAALDTLYGVIVTLARLLAPFMPFVTEQMFRNLVRSVDAEAPVSVHLTDWPIPDVGSVDSALLADMTLARQVVTLGHSARNNANIKLRQPLARAVVVLPDPSLRDRLLRLSDIVADELNVKALEVTAEEAELVEYRLLPDNRKLGPRFGRKFPAVRQALAQADAIAAVRVLRAGQPLMLTADGERVELAPDEVLIQTAPRVGFAVAAAGGITVAVDTHLTESLMYEGLAREVIRRIQNLRKEAGFAIEDRIVTEFAADGQLATAVQVFADFIQEETLSVEMRLVPTPSGEAVQEDTVDGQRLVLGLRRTQRQ